ncbi:MAG: lipid II flippase MurJ, partial [Nitrosomonadales bacterium]|nr:lipid II flippase MurJ [Nitrosomonadales bacterium]
NLVIVQLKLRAYKTSVVPDIRLPKMVQFSALFNQYWPLVGSAVFISIGIPIATLLAMSLSDGAVSVFSLGSKVVLFVTGLLGAVITTVMLPYFSNLMAKKHLVDARRELSFFLLTATFIAVPLSVGIYLYSNLIVDLMLAGGDFSIESKEQVTRVMKYSIVQLPFFVCNALLLRFAISTKHVLSIFVVAVLGLTANVVISMLLMNHMGVAGIALGGSVAMLISTILLALVLVRFWHITLLDLIIILLNWMLFVTLLIGVHFNNLPSVYVVIVAYVVLMTGYLKSLVSFPSLSAGVKS